jgi:hypothetical protein
MVLISGGTFRMGSDKHYPEEAPAHRVTVGAFWTDRYPVTNRQFMEFVKATGHVTFAEIPPDPKDYPGALPHMLYAGSLVFSPPARPVDLRNWGEWWMFLKGAAARPRAGPDLMRRPGATHRGLAVLVDHSLPLRWIVRSNCRTDKGGSADAGYRHRRPPHRHRRVCFLCRAAAPRVAPGKLRVKGVPQ